MKSLFLLPLFITSSVLAQEPDSSSALFGMREAERNFAKASVMIGRNAAFTEYFADESVLFTDKWITNGKQVSRERKPSPIVLKWEPEFMDISASRDFGISTGPWEVQEYRPNTDPLFTGYFLTVWKKQSTGEWKVILDGGSATPVAEATKHKFTFPSGADKPVPNPPVMNVQQLTKELLDRDVQFESDWKKNPSTFISFLAPDARIQLGGHLPTTNADTIKSWVNQFDRSLTWQPVGAGVASSGDLGFTYGLVTTQNKEVVKGHYVLIWKKRAGSSWQIVLEMVNFG
jgi:ketosteroid isomerase-like protein